MERRGIVTVSLSTTREISEKVRSPRSLLVPFRFGFPLGRPDDPPLQREVIETALEMARDGSLEPGTIHELIGS
jgi:hypothetical protein